MFIECFSNNGVDYLRVMEGYRVRDTNGQSKSKRRIVRNIGPLSRYDDNQPDYLLRLRQSFKDGHPLINELTDLVNDKKPADYIMIRFDRHVSTECICEPKNIGYFFLDGLYDALGIYDVLNKYKSNTKIEYDLNGLTKLLVFGRVFTPDSKCETWNGRNTYVFDVVSSESQIEIYRVLDALDATAKAIQQRMNYKITKGIGRNSDICYYDVINYWFEIDDNDDDIHDSNGEVLQEGMRKREPSKAKNRKPIVQMGLFIDDNGIPISYHLFPGNHIDQTTLRPALKDSIDKMGFGKVVIIADGGLNSDKNIAHVLSEGNGYVLSKSTKKSAKNVKTWILDENGYEWNQNHTFKVKSMIRERTIKDENNDKILITEKLICYWSLGHYNRELKENKKFIEYLETVIRLPDKLKDNEKKIEKFLKSMNVDKESGEIIDTKKILSIDMAKVKEYMDLMGYYTLLTSETKWADKEVINKYHGLSRIEDSFRVTKSDLDGRPVYVRTREHINAHFLVCYIALTMLRLIQYRVLTNEGKSGLNEDGWEAGLSAERIKKALGLFMADALPNGYFRLTTVDNDLKMIMQAFGITQELCLPTVSQLRKLKSVIDKAVMN